MKAYLYLIISILRARLFYLAEVLVNIGLEIFYSITNLLVFFFVNSGLKVFTSQQVLIYSLVSNTLITIHTPTATYTFSYFVTSGDISTYLTRPINVILYLYILSCVDQYPKLFINMFIFDFIGLLLHISPIQLAISNLLVILLSIPYLIFMFFIEAIFMSISLSLEKVNTLRSAANHLIRLIGGGLVPVEFISNSIKNTFLYYCIGFYADLAIGNVTLQNVLGWFVWACLLGGIALMVYKKNIRNFSVNGG